MFAKVFSQIFDSSIAEKPELRFTFMDMLVLADQNGVVDMTHEAIARRTNRPVELIRKTVEELERPDPLSRTPDCKGARIQRLDKHRDWGWLIVNYGFFRQLASEEQRRAKTAARVKRHRDKQAKGKAEAEAEGKTLQSVTERFSAFQGQEFFPSDNLPPPLNTAEMGDAWDNWQLHKKQKGETMTERALSMAINKLKAMGPEHAAAAIEHSIANNYSGIFEPRDSKQPTPTPKTDWSKITSENALKRRKQ